MGGGSPTATASEPSSGLDFPSLPLSSSSSSTLDGCNSSRVYSRSKCKIYKEIMQSYQAKSMQTILEALEDAKQNIVSYKPGLWIEDAGGLKRSNYDIPRTTTLLVIGPKGSGKSSLVNRISRVFENDKFSTDRAQVFYNSSGDGTYFLQEFMIPRSSASFSLFDTRSLSEKLSDNSKLLKTWMTTGVRHGQMVIRDSDSVTVHEMIVKRGRHALCCPCKKRRINFVIFVVDGVSVKKSMASGDNAQYTSLVAETFNCPYLSFKDDKPVVVVTHGDELTFSDRAHVRVHLGKLLGIPPATQIFDIPDKYDLSSELTIVEMLRYCLEHSDRNLPFKQRASPIMALGAKTLRATMMLIIVIQILRLAIARMPVRGRRPPPELNIDWHKIRHLW